MPTIAVVGAGPGQGLPVARAFGGHGFDVALISRTKDRLHALVAELAELAEVRITAEVFPADAGDSAQLTDALGPRSRGSGGSRSWSPPRMRACPWPRPRR